MSCSCLIVSPSTFFNTRFCSVMIESNFEFNSFIYCFLSKNSIWKVSTSFRESKTRKLTRFSMSFMRIVKRFEPSFCRLCRSRKRLPSVPVSVSSLPRALSCRAILSCSSWFNAMLFVCISPLFTSRLRSTMFLSLICESNAFSLLKLLFSVCLLKEKILRKS